MEIFNNLSYSHAAAYFLLGLTSFLNILVPLSGSAIVTPLLTLLLDDPRKAIGLTSAFFVMSGIIRILFFREKIQWSEVRVLWLPSVAAAAVGAFALLSIPPVYLVGLILGFAMYFMLKKFGVIPKREKPLPVLEYFIGLFSGFLQGTGLAGSDLRNQYLYAQGLDIAEVHGTTALIGWSNFFVATVVRLMTGQLTLPDIEPLGYLLPVVFLAIWMGKRTLYKVPKSVADGIIKVVMVLVVLSLCYELVKMF